MPPYQQDNDQERICRLEMLLEQLQRQNDELKERVQSELDRLRAERRIPTAHETDVVKHSTFKP